MACIRKITIDRHGVVTSDTGIGVPEPKPPARPRAPGLPLGDYTERLLASAGITEDKWRAVKKQFGLAPTCNCQKRKDWLNSVGAWLAGE